MDIISTETSKAAIRSLMAIFSRYGVPDSPQDLALHCQNLQNLLVSETFDMSIRVPAISEEQWKTENGLAPLETSSTPCEGMDTSPAQRVFDCHCKTLLPTPEALRKPRFSLITDARKLLTQKERQRKFYKCQALSCSTQVG